VTANFQVSAKVPDGRIFVVGGEDFNTFYENTRLLYGGDEDKAVKAMTDMQEAFSGGPVNPTVNAVAQIQQAYPQAQVQAAQPQQYQNPQQAYQQPPQAPMNQNRQNDGPPPGFPIPYCPNHGMPAQWNKPGIGRGTGKPYKGFFGCAQGRNNGCKIPQDQQP
jgi:hypothetical protein